MSDDEADSPGESDSQSSDEENEFMGDEEPDGPTPMDTESKDSGKQANTTSE